MDRNDIPRLKSPLPEKCVSCGEPIEFSEHGLPNHHCSPQHEAAVERANRRAENGPSPRKIPYGERLQVGFSMLLRS